MVSCVRGEKRRKKGKECVRLTCGSKERNWESGISSFLSLKLILGVAGGGVKLGKEEAQHQGSREGSGGGGGGSWWTRGGSSVRSGSGVSSTWEEP